MCSDNLFFFQFDREADEYIEMQKKDFAFARHVAKAHSISDSEDSNSTVDPHDDSELNGSLDLFDDSKDKDPSTTPCNEGLSVVFNWVFFF